MQKPDIQDNRNFPVLPRVNVIVSADRAHVIESIEKQEYANKNVLLSNENPIEFFNRCINQLRTEPPSIIVCLDNKNWFSQSNSIALAVARCARAAGVYSDVLLQGTGYKYREYLPPFSASDILKGRHPFSRPFFVHSTILPHNPIQNTEHFFLQLKATLCQGHYLEHLAEPIMAGSNE